MRVRRLASGWARPWPSSPEQACGKLPGPVISTSKGRPLPMTVEVLRARTEKWPLSAHTPDGVLPHNSAAHDRCSSMATTPMRTSSMLPSGACKRWRQPSVSALRSRKQNQLRSAHRPGKEQRPDRRLRPTTSSTPGASFGTGKSTRPQPPSSTRPLQPGSSRRPTKLVAELFGK